MMVDSKRLVIRADASTRMGTGHVMRCLALAQAWQENGGTAEFVLGTATPAIIARLSDEDMGAVSLDALPGSVSDAEGTIDLAQRSGADWVVVDGYQFDAAYQRAIKEAGLQLLVLDDYGHASHYHADLVLNQNIYAQEGLYASREPYTHLLLDTRYALLRREFWPWRGWQREISPVARKVLVTMGGSDPDNVTLMVVEALSQMSETGIEAVIVVGGSNPHYDRLEQAIQSAPCEIRLERNVTHMPERMAWADMAVSAGGSTCWELAFMGLPTLILILAENQRPIAEGLDTRAVAANLGWHDQSSSAQLFEVLAELSTAQQKRAHMSHKGRQLVDGDGGRRVAEMIATPRIRVRPVSRDDRQRLFIWANDPLTRRMSFNTRPIDWTEHQQWFERAVNSPDSLLLIAELYETNEWKPIAQVRLDGDGVVSISMSPEYRRRRLAALTLNKAIAHFGKLLPRQNLTAYIKPDNLASLKLFAQVGFECMGETEISGQPCLKYVFRQQGGLPQALSSKEGEYVQDR